MSVPKSPATPQFEPANMASTTPTANVEIPKMDDTTSTPIATADTNITLNTADKAVPTFFNRMMSKIADFLLPTFLHQEYSNIIAFLAKGKYAFLALGLTIFFALAELEQPGHFPRPVELSCALVGFLCAGSLVFGSFALLEYVETHTWPWEDDGWVWPWEALLWSNTVYDDDFGASITEYVKSSTHTPVSHSSTEVDGWTIVEGSATPDPPPVDDPIIPPTPLLPDGLRPIHPPSPQSMHHSGLLGESPAPIKFKHFSGNGFRGLGNDIKEEEGDH